MRKGRSGGKLYKILLTFIFIVAPINFMNNYTFVIDCTDNRNGYLLKSMIIDNYSVQVFTRGVKYNDDNINYVFIFAPSTFIDLEIANSISNKSIVFCVKYDESLLPAFKEKNITLNKLFDDEVLAMKNAYITAEGTLAYIIQNTDISIINMKVLVLGYGRVGKAVSKILHDNRSIVSVATNNKDEYAFASIYADNVYDLTEIDKILKNFSVIVNTIPCLILKGDMLKQISEECFIIDLASYPGGLDYKQAQKLNLKTMHALGIPGKIAPKTAGEEIKKSVLKILSKL